MITIKALDGGGLAAFASQNGIEIGGANAARVAYDGAVISGYVVFNIQKGELINLAFSDDDIGDGLVKAAADDCFRAGTAQLKCGGLGERADRVMLAAGFLPRADGVMSITEGSVRRACDRK